MNDTSRALIDYFGRLGFPAETGALYVCLKKGGPQTISELSRNSGVERTRVYRLIPEMQENNLVTIDTEYKHGIITAAPVDSLSIHLAKREQEIADLQQELPFIQAAIASIDVSPKPTSVKFYRGKSGVKQMLWNETNASSEIVSILHEGIQLKTDSKFFERWVEKCNTKQLTFRSVVSDDFVRKQSKWYESHFNDQLQHWQGREIAESVFSISHGTVIYDEVVGYFYWDDEEIFGVEIHNATIAKTQRQFFDLLWDQAQPINRV